MVDLAKTAILWLLPLAFFTTVFYRTVFLYPQSSRQGLGHYKSVESPALPLWIPILVLQTCILLFCGKQLPRLKVTMFWSLFFTTLAVRSLTLLSALCTSESDDGDDIILPWLSTSLFKPFWLICLCDALDEFDLGRYQPYPYDEMTESAPSLFWGLIKPTEDRLLYPWRDLVVRLGYVHVIDNLVHVVWLRYIYHKGPYTAYINNSELLTILLLIQMSIYTCAERGTRVEHGCEVEAGGVVRDEKVDVGNVV